MSSLKKLLNKMMESEAIRYLFFGGCTTLVNYVVYYVFLHVFHVELNISNLISIIAAVLFAYVVNLRYVFRYECKTLKDHVGPFLRFIGARAFSMLLEFFGVWLLVGKLSMNDMVGKVIVSIVVIILNYFFSKFFVFQKSAEAADMFCSVVIAPVWVSVSSVHPCQKLLFSVSF